MGPNLPETFARSSEPSGYRNVAARQPDGDLSQNMLRFSSLLRKRGFTVGVAEATEVLRVLPRIDMVDWKEFHLVLRALFVSRWEQLVAFDALFHSFWTGWGGFEQSAHQLFETPPERRGFSTGESRAAGQEGGDDLVPEG